MQSYLISRFSGKKDSHIYKFLFKLLSFSLKRSFQNVTFLNCIFNNCACVKLLKKYKELLDMGVITEDEFKKKKEELL